MIRLRQCVAAVIVGSIIGTGASYAADKLQPHTRTCFPATLWSLKDRNRPCGRLVRVYEDGSYRVRVFEADGDRWKER